MEKQWSYCDIQAQILEGVGTAECLAGAKELRAKYEELLDQWRALVATVTDEEREAHERVELARLEARAAELREKGQMTKLKRLEILRNARKKKGARSK